MGGGMGGTSGLSSGKRIVRGELDWTVKVR